MLPGCILNDCSYVYDDISSASTPIEFCTGLDALWYDGDNDLPACIENHCTDDEIIRLARFANICKECIAVEDEAMGSCNLWQDAQSNYNPAYNPCDDGYHPTNMSWNAICTDCNDEVNGNAFIDACESCVGGTTLCSEGVCEPCQKD